MPKPACSISSSSQHPWPLSRSSSRLLWTRMAHWRHAQGHLHAHTGLSQHHPTVSCNESGCVEAELMPPQLLKRSRRRTHNATPAVLFQPAAHRNRRPDAASPSSRWMMGGGDKQHSVALLVTTWGNWIYVVNNTPALSWPHISNEYHWFLMLKEEPLLRGVCVFLRKFRKQTTITT